MVADWTRGKPRREQAGEEAEVARRKSSYRLYARPRERRPANPGDRARHKRPLAVRRTDHASDRLRFPGAAAGFLRPTYHS